MKHIAGPWEISKTQGLTIIAPDSKLPDNREYTVCNWHTDERSEKSDLANANLICAAPDMIRALITIACDDSCPNHIADLILPIIDKAKGD